MHRHHAAAANDEVEFAVRVQVRGYEFRGGGSCIGRCPLVECPITVTEKEIYGVSSLENCSDSHVQMVVAVKVPNGRAAAQEPRGKLNLRADGPVAVAQRDPNPLRPRGMKVQTDNVL